MRVLVCGGRDFKDAALMAHWLDALHASRPFSVVIHGAARGADHMAGEWAELNGIEVVKYPAQWRALGISAGPLRNEQMLADGAPDLVVAFPGGPGTAHMVRIARKAGVRVVEVV